MDETAKTFAKWWNSLPEHHPLKARYREFPSTLDAVYECWVAFQHAQGEQLLAAIRRHHSQRADDRCFLDDIELYAAAGLDPADTRVGNKDAMLENCKRFLAQRCESGGPWRSYAELEAENAHFRQKWQDYEQHYILPVFEWATELGLDLRQRVYDNPGKNCVVLFFEWLRDERGALRTALAEKEVKS